MVVRRLVQALRGRTGLLQTVAVPGFDPVFYRRSNPDLHELTDDAALEQHFRTHGRAEGRAANEAEALAALIETHGEPPTDFDPGEYLDCNPDLRPLLTSDWQATEHYLRFGREEKRRTFVLDVELYRDLYFAGETASDARVREHFETSGRKAGLIRSPADFMRRRGLPGRGRWMTRLDVREFRSINWTWAKSVTTRLDAVEAMLAEGIDRLAPIASRLVFEPAYQREVHAGTPTAELDDAALYHRWLFEGFEVGERPSAAEHLHDLKLPLSSYPERFDWRAYAARRKLARPSGWAALDDLVAEGALQGVVGPAEGGDDAAFLAAVGVALAVRADKASVLWLEKARSVGVVPPEAMQSLADSYYRLERWDEARSAYETVASRPEANVWTFINGAKAAVRAKATTTALELLEAGHRSFAGDRGYRAVVQEVVEADFASVMSNALGLYGQGSRSEADTLLSAAVRTSADRWRALDPLGAPIAPLPEGRVVVLANVDLRQCTHYRVEQKVQLFIAADREFQIFQAAHADGFMAALPGATAAIFYRLAGLPTNVRAIEYARSLGVPTYYEIDDLIFSDAYPDPLESYGGSITPEVYAGLQAGVPLFRAAMQLCDYGIASTAPLAEAMKPIVRTGEVFVLPNGLDDRNEAFAGERPARVRRDDDIVLFYGSGTKAHNSDFLELAGPALAEIMAARSDVRLMIVGYLVLDDRLAAFSDRITALDFVPDARSYWSLLAEADINLAVLAPGVVTDAKSEIKWLEAAVLGIPSVVSDTATYRGGLEDGVDVLMARTAQDWREALSRLIDDAALRRSIGERARAKATTDFSVEANAVRLAELLAPADARVQS